MRNSKGSAFKGKFAVLLSCLPFAFSACTSSKSMLVDGGLITYANPRYFEETRLFEVDKKRAEQILNSLIGETDYRVIKLMRTRTSNGFFGYIGVLKDWHLFGLVQKGPYRDSYAKFTGFYVNARTGDCEFRHASGFSRCGEVVYDDIQVVKPENPDRPILSNNSRQP